MLIEAFDIAGLVVTGVIACAAAFVLAVLIRQTMLQRRGAGVLCAMRTGSSWHLGVVRYGSKTLQWYRLISLTPRPSVVFVRGGTTVLARRPAGIGVRHLLPHAALIARCRARSAAGNTVDVELAFSAAGWTGFLAWLESAPPATVDPSPTTVAPTIAVPSGPTAGTGGPPEYVPGAGDRIDPPGQHEQ